MSRTRLVSLTVVVVGLVALVAIAAGGRPLGAGNRGRGGLPLSFWDYVFTTVVIVSVVFLLVLGFLAIFIRPKPGKPRDIFQRSMILTLVYLVGLSSLALLLVRHHLLPHLHLAQQQQGLGNPNVTLPPEKSTDATRTPHLRWDEIVIVLGLMLGVAAIFVTSRARRGPRLFGSRDDAPEAVAAALELSLDDLRTDPDLRRAIIAAYARMEAALGVAGIPRRPSEAPLEYVERALLTLHASAGAVRSLTELFEWARFSHHEPEPSMRDDAVEALVAVRDELRASELIPA